MAPSIYEYRAEREWAQAMAEWCAENEPQYFVTYFDATADDWVRVRVESLEAAHTLANEKHIPELEEKPFILVAPGGRHLDPDAQIIRPFGEPGYTSIGCHISDHLPGGSTADYRAAGFRRL